MQDVKAEYRERYDLMQRNMAKVTSRLTTQKDKLGLSPRENVAVDSARLQEQPAESPNLEKKKSKRKKKQKSADKYKDIVVLTVDT